jgi:hypothetical protein
MEKNKGHRHKSTQVQEPEFFKGASNIRWIKDTFFNKCCWENWLSTYRRLKLNPCHSLSIHINLKLIKDLNIRPETLKLLHKRGRNTLEYVNIGNIFLNVTPAPQQLRERIDKTM